MQATDAKCRMQVFAIAIMLLLSYRSAIAQASPQLSDSLKGEWVLTLIYPTHNVQGLSPAQQHRLLHSHITFDNRSLHACGQHIKIDKLKTQSVSAHQFFGQRRVAFAEVEVSAPALSEFVINDETGGNCFGTYAIPGEHFFVKTTNELLVDFEGVYYRAVRLRRKGKGVEKRGEKGTA